MRNLLLGALFIVASVVTTGCGTPPSASEGEEAATLSSALLSEEAHVATPDELNSEPLEESTYLSLTESRIPAGDETAYTWCGGCLRGPGTFLTTFPDGAGCVITLASGVRRKQCHNRGTRLCAAVRC